LIIIVMTAAAAGLSRVLPRGVQWVMEFNHVFSMLGVVFTALYVTLVKVVATYYECRPNPNGDDTLLKFRDVTCGGEEHTKGLPAMVVGLVFYLIGFYCVFLNACYNASSYWGDVGFRERWRFMFQRWRPSTYYWGCVVITRNMLVALVGVMSSEARVQLLIVVIIVMLVTCCTANSHPWRADALNIYDVSSSYVLALVGIFGLIFLSLRVEETMNERHDKLDEAKAVADDLSTFGTFLAVLICIFIAMFFMIITWCFAMFMPSYRNATAKKVNEDKRAFVELVMTQAKDPDLKRKMENLVAELTMYDQRSAEHLFLMLEAQGGESKASADTIMMGMRKHGSSHAQTVRSSDNTDAQAAPQTVSA
jgi:uncharacterized membrane protein